MPLNLMKCAKILVDEKQPLAKRFRALFTLRNIITNDSIDVIGKVLLTDDSDLLKHECAYCLGQMKDPFAIPYLIKCLKDEQQHPMVRHEAGEALGAIGAYSEDILDLLKKYSNHDSRVLSETCQLALDRLDWYNRGSIGGDEEESPERHESRSPYDTVDPTPSYPKTMEIQDLANICCDEKASLFDRYRALFTLRNVKTPAAVEAICRSLFGSPDNSVLYKHEVAFVLGQLQMSEATTALAKKLADLDENEIVRHECAEALGSIGNHDEISKYLNDKSRIVRESCEVALDMAQYYNDAEQFDFVSEDCSDGESSP